MLKSEMGGYLKEAVVALTMPPADYDARSIHKAISVRMNNRRVNTLGKEDYFPLPLSYIVRARLSQLLRVQDMT